MHRRTSDIDAHLAQSLPDGALDRLIGETAGTRPMGAGKRGADVPRPVPSPLSGRTRQATAQEQKIRHGAHPMPRTIGGPSRLATASGNRFQAAIKSRYFGLSGL